MGMICMHHARRFDAIQSEMVSFVATNLKDQDTLVSDCNPKSQKTLGHVVQSSKQCQSNKRFQALNKHKHSQYQTVAADVVVPAG